MVFVKVRETYDLHTIQNKMTVISIHTPHPIIIKKNFPGLLMQCRAYRPVSADVRVACASVLPLDPKGVGTTENDVAPEDIFNPILYKAMSNLGMSQLEARINQLGINGSSSTGADVYGYSAAADVDSVTNYADEFPIYYGLLSNAHKWKHANPQSGLEMKGLKPLVYDIFYNQHDQYVGGLSSATPPQGPDAAGTTGDVPLASIRGNAHYLPFINCTSYSLVKTKDTGIVQSGFPNPDGAAGDYIPYNASVNVPWINVVCGAIIIPPSRLHELYYRMVVEWTIEFTKIRPISEITDWGALASLGNTTHYQNYDYSSTKAVVTGSSDTILDQDSTMVSANVDIEKVM